MGKNITKTVVDRLKPGQSVADSNPRGFMARRLPSGVVTYGFRYWDKVAGKQPWIGIGIHGEITVEQARTKALQLAKAVRENNQRPRSARQEATQRRTGTVNTMLDAFLDRHVRPNLRTASDIERMFNVDVRPRIGTRSIYDLRRRDVIELLDAIEDRDAPVYADRVLANLRKAFNWQAARDEDFKSPIVKGMAKTKPAERARRRILDDQEIRDLYAALDQLGKAAPKCVPNFIKVLLLTGQRRRMVSDMPWSEIEGSEWTVPPGRNKTGVDHVVPLTQTVAALIGPKQKAGFVFSSDGGKTSFKGFSKAKVALDVKLADVRKAAGQKAVEHWTFHDLRRTARSLMSRAGVPSDVGERVLGHKIAGVRGVYDRYEFADEKHDALEKLDALIQRILQPDRGVVRFPKGRKKR